MQFCQRQTADSQILPHAIATATKIKGRDGENVILPRIVDFFSFWRQIRCRRLAN